MRTRDKLRRVVPAGTNMYKYVVNYDNGQLNYAIVKLLTLEPGIVVDTVTRFKICRAPKVYVDSIVASTDPTINSWKSTFDPSFVYNIKDVAVAINYDSNTYHLCSGGINCFATVKEAVEYLNQDTCSKLKVKKGRLCEVFTK